MKLMATCLNCGRDFQLDQLIEGPVIDGRCPWCGELLAPNYTSLMPEVIRRAERGGDHLESALRMLTGSWARFRIKPESVLEPLREVLGPTAEEWWERDRAAMRDRIRRVLRWTEGPAGAASEGWPQARDDLHAIEDDLRHVAKVTGGHDGEAAEAAGRAVDDLARTAADSGGSADDVRADVARLGESTRGAGQDQSGPAAAADALADARRAVGESSPSGEQVREALKQLLDALRKAEEALAASGY